MRTQNLRLKGNRKDIPIKPPDLELESTLVGSNYLCLKLIFMVQKTFDRIGIFFLF